MLLICLYLLPSLHHWPRQEQWAFQVTSMVLIYHLLTFSLEVLISRHFQLSFELEWLMALFQYLFGSGPCLFDSFESASLLLLEQWDSVVHLKHFFLDLNPRLVHFSHTIRQNLLVTFSGSRFLSYGPLLVIEGVEALYRFWDFIIIFFNRG